MEPENSDIEDNDIQNLDEFIFIPIDCPLAQLLKEWDMEFLLPKLINRNINMSNLKYLTEIEISSIFENDLGNQACFKAKFIEWKRKNNLPHCKTLNDSFETESNTSSNHLILQQFSADTEILHSTTPTSMTPSPSPTVSPIFFDLKFFFESATGNSIKKMYDTHKPPQFTPELRELLCTYIARYYVKHNRCMTLTDFRSVTSQIVDFFPEENAEYYFKTTKNPSGKLYNKYRVISKNLRRIGCFTDIKRRRTQTPLADTQESDAELTDNEEVCDNKDWLKVHNTPWQIVEQKWTDTFNIRSRQVDKAKDTASLFMKWPLYTNTKGFRLIEIDFERIYPNNHGQLFKSWGNFKSKIGDIFKKHLKDKAAVEIFKNLSNNEDIHHIQLCKFLHFVLKPSGKLKPQDKIWKFTINDSIESFIVEVTDASQVAEKIETAKSFCISKNLRLQPFIIYINCSEPQYPKQSEKFWLFIQKYLYNITTKFDNLTPDLIDIISQINK